MAYTTLIIPAAGQGTRFGGMVPKQFTPVEGKPLLFWTLEAVLRARFADHAVVVLPRGDFPRYRSMVASWYREFEEKGVISSDGEMFTTIPGGAERQESVWLGLRALPDNTEWVVIHDGARPLASPELFSRVIEGAKMVGAAIAATRTSDTVKRTTDGTLIAETLDRSTIWLAQTPQVFKRSLIVRAYEEAIEHHLWGTDDASLVERLAHPVAIVEGEPLNLKITTPQDLEWLSWHLQKKTPA